MTATLQQTGNNAVAYVRSRARRDANSMRLIGYRMSEWMNGHFFGQLLVARHDLGADEIELQGVENEVRFLALRYGRS